MTYEGQWIDNAKNGQGKQTWKQGYHYDGEWKDGERTGNAKFTTL